LKKNKLNFVKNNYYSIFSCTYFFDSLVMLFLHNIFKYKFKQIITLLKNISNEEWIG